MGKTATPVISRSEHIAFSLRSRPGFLHDPNCHFGSVETTNQLGVAVEERGLEEAVVKFKQCLIDIKILF